MVSSRLKRLIFSALKCIYEVLFIIFKQQKKEPVILKLFLNLIAGYLPFAVNFPVQLHFRRQLWLPACLPVESAMVDQLWYVNCFSKGP